LPTVASAEGDVREKKANVNAENRKKCVLRLRSDGIDFLVHENCAGKSVP
jgi:hypothetical protein